MKYMQYTERKVPEDILDKLEKAAQEMNSGQRHLPMTLGEAGFFDWLTSLSAKDGWRVVWSASNFPNIVLEKEVENNE